MELVQRLEQEPLGKTRGCGSVRWLIVVDLPMKNGGFTHFIVDLPIENGGFTHINWKYMENMVIYVKIYGKYMAIYGCLPSGKLTVCELEHGPVEIVDLPSYKMVVIFHSFMLTFTRG